MTPSPAMNGTKNSGRNRTMHDRTLGQQGRGDLAERRPAGGEGLGATQYLYWLLEEARRLGWATDSQIGSLQLELMQLLASEAQRYTGGESSSVTEETARRILQSILYSVGMHLKGLGSAEAAWAAMCGEPIAALHRHGQRRVKTHLEAARNLYGAVIEERLTTENLAYNATLEDGLPGFFAAYDPEFAAAETPASIDYPLCDDRQELTGGRVHYAIPAKAGP